MKKFSMAVAAMSVIVAMFAMVGQAGASTWHTNGPRSISGTARRTTQLRVGSIVLKCTTSTATGSLLGGTVSTTTWNGVARITPAFSNCTSAGVQYVVACNDGGTGFPTKTDPAAPLATLNALVFNNRIVVGSEAASVGLRTTGTLTGIFCDVGLRAGTNWCKRIASATGINNGGSVQGTYTNPTTDPGSDGTLDISNTGQDLSVYTSTKGGACAAIPNGAAVFTDDAGNDAVYGGIDAFIWQSNP